MSRQLTNQQVQARDNDLIADSLKLRFFPLDVASGEGARLTDTDGKEYLDFSALWAFANIGYSHPVYKQHMIDQMERTTFAGLISNINQPALNLAEKLIALTPGDFDKKCWFGFCGSDANETVGRLLPIATGKKRLISFVGSYHGFTAASMAMSGHVAFSDFVGSNQTIKIPYPNPYRPVFAEDGADEAQKVLHYLEDFIFKQVVSPDDVAGVLVEAIQSDGGLIVPTDDFLPGLAELCQKYGIYLVLDEVKVGMGRTGKLFAFEHYDVTPDVVVLGKSLGGGVPLSAVVARKEILDAGTSLALFTAAGNAMSCTGGLGALAALEADNMIENAAKVGDYLHEKLLQLKDKYPLIGDVRGKGLSQGVELVSDPITREPADKETAKITYHAYRLGLLFYYVGTFSNVLEITPPLLVNNSDVDEAIGILDQAITDVVAGKVSDEEIAAFAGW